jgi:hypothetical protein
MLTKTQVKVILALLDTKGHAQWQLAESLGMEASNLNPILKDLDRRKLISKGKVRLSERQHENEGIYAEFPYYLSQDLDIFKTLIREIAMSDKPYDTGFLLEIIDNSKYLKMMEAQFQEDLNKIVNEELSKSYSPYSDPFFEKVIKPELVEELFCNLERLVTSEVRS